nr:hypothetical protein [Tanacetum cinerariifolium]
MFEARQATVLFTSCLNDYCCEEKKGSYGSQLLDAYSYGALHIDNSIPPKEKDPRSFTLPCYINNVFFDTALADIRSSVSVMPLPTYLNLGLGELAHTKLTVELPDRTVKYPKGIAKNARGCEAVDKQMIEEVKARDDNTMGSKNFGYPSDYNQVVEDMDPYLDEGIGEVVVGEPFRKSILRFKDYTNEQCKKILPLLKVREKDKMNGISHPYQKLKGFYKGVLNLEPDFI